MLVSTIVDMKAVDSTKDSQRLWLRVDGSTEESQTEALVASGRLFGRESYSGSGCEWTALQKRVKQRLWLQVDGSTEES